MSLAKLNFVSQLRLVKSSSCSLSLGSKLCMAWMNKSWTRLSVRVVRMTFLGSLFTGATLGASDRFCIRFILRLSTILSMRSLLLAPPGELLEILSILGGLVRCEAWILWVIVGILGWFSFVAWTGLARCLNSRMLESDSSSALLLTDAVCAASASDIFGFVLFYLKLKEN